MTITVDKVQYGVVPYGPGNGTHAIGITFKEVEGDLNTSLPKDENGNDISMSEDEAIAHNIFTQVTDLIKNEGINEQFIDFLLGRKYCYFIGDVVTDSKYRKYMNIFFEVISHTALDLQKKIFADTNATQGDKMRQLRAPLMAYVCSPVNFTGKVAFYENFNIVINKLPITDKTDDYNPIAFMEIQNHKFSVDVIDFGDNISEQLEKFEKKFIENDLITIPVDRVFIVDSSSKEDDGLIAISEKYGYRLNKKMTYKGTLDF